MKYLKLSSRCMGQKAYEKYMSNCRKLREKLTALTFSPVPGIRYALLPSTTHQHSETCVVLFLQEGEDESLTECLLESPIRCIQQRHRREGKKKLQKMLTAVDMVLGLTFLILKSGTSFFFFPKYLLPFLMHFETRIEKIPSIFFARYGTVIVDKRNTDVLALS